MTDTLFKSDDSFLIGIEELDHEHKVLIDDINRLHDELARHGQKSKIKNCLGDIYARMQAHFALEESVMVSHRYAHYADHKAEHERLLDEYAERMTKFDRAPNPKDRKALEDVLGGWIIDHILITDKKMSLMIAGGNRT